MTYNGKEVFTQETFSYAKVQIGDYVSQEVVDDAMDILPPVCMSSACSQVGEPHSTRLGPNTGKYRNTYETFKRVTEGQDGIWQYCGDCFAGETTKRGTEPPYVRLRE